MTISVLFTVMFNTFAQSTDLCIYDKNDIKVYIYENQNDDVVVLFENITEGDSYKSFFMMHGQSNIEQTYNLMIYVKNKFVEYDSIAIANNVTDIKKDLGLFETFDKCNLFVWDNSYKVGVGNNYKYPMTQYYRQNDYSCIRIFNWYKTSFNKFVKVYTELRFDDANDLEEFANLFKDYQHLKDLIRNNDNVEALFN